jgi:hypothetical protein
MGIREAQVCLSNTVHVLILLRHLKEAPLSLIGGGSCYIVNKTCKVSLSAPHR